MTCQLRSKHSRILRCRSFPLPIVRLFYVLALIVVIMFIKGAPDVLMPRCRWVLLPNGDRIPMSQSLADEITNTQMRWSTAGQRVLLLARRVISGADVEVKEFGSAEMVQYIVRDYTDDLVVVGMIGIVDPPRKDIPEVVRICRGGGIRFFMVLSFSSDGFLTSIGHWRLCKDCRSYCSPSRNNHICSI